MKGIQYSTKKELYEAKKILYEGSNATKKTFLAALAALVKKSHETTCFFDPLVIFLRFLYYCY